MNSKRLIFVMVISVLSSVFQSGCAATSSTRRYNGKKQEAAKDTVKILRYSDVTEKDTSQNISEEYQDWDDEPGDYTSSDDTTIIANLLKKFTVTDLSKLDPNKETPQEKVVMEIIKYISTPYRYGGNSMKGIDCSAFTQNIFGNVFSYELPRSAREQYEVGEIISDKGDLKFGDLIFFNTRRRAKPGHVGIYLGDNLFAHASRKKGVTVSSLDENYYQSRYMGGRRLDGLPIN